jgi:hypothetical protein
LAGIDARRVEVAATAGRVRTPEPRGCDHRLRR